MCYDQMPYHRSSRKQLPWPITLRSTPYPHERPWCTRMTTGAAFRKKLQTCKKKALIEVQLNQAQVPCTATYVGTQNVTEFTTFVHANGKSKYTTAV